MIGRYILGLLLGPLLTIIMEVPLIFIGVYPMVIALHAYMAVIYVPVYGTVAILYSIKSLLGLIVLINFIPLAIFGYNCLKNGCLHLFEGWGGEYLGMVYLCVIFSFWAFVLWLFVREKSA